VRFFSNGLLIVVVLLKVISVYFFCLNTFIDIVDGLIVFRTFSEKYTKHERTREKSELGGEFDSLFAPPLVFS